MAAVSPAQGAAPDAQFSVWKPFLVRAIMSAVFGILTIFWREPSTAVLSVAGGLYLLFLGVTYLWTHRRVLGVRSSLPTSLGGGLLVVAAVLTLILMDDRSFAFAGAAALVVAGGAEVARGVTVRGHIAARDLVTVGAVMAATGAILPFFEHLGAHALLGVTGGGALITAVVLGIAALSYRHDSALSTLATPGAAHG